MSLAAGIHRTPRWYADWTLRWSSSVAELLELAWPGRSTTGKSVKEFEVNGFGPVAAVSGLELNRLGVGYHLASSVRSELVPMCCFGVDDPWMAGGKVLATANVVRDCTLPLCRLMDRIIYIHQSKSLWRVE
jgi:hypothetical protein